MSSARSAPANRSLLCAVTPSAPRWKYISPATRPPAKVPSISSNVSSDGARCTMPRTFLAASRGVSATCADFTTTRPVRSPSRPWSNGSAGQTAVAGPPCTGVPIATAMTTGRLISPTSRAPLTAIGRASPILRRPPTSVPAALPAMSARSTAPSASVRLADSAIGSVSAGRPAATGRGLRKFAFATLIATPAVGPWLPTSRTVPLVDRSRPPATSWPSTAMSPFTGPLAVRLRRPGRLSTVTSESRPKSSTSTPPSPASSRRLD